jgi:hypothetical protein
MYKHEGEEDDIHGNSHFSGFYRVYAAVTTTKLAFWKLKLPLAQREFVTANKWYAITVHQHDLVTHNRTPRCADFMTLKFTFLEHKCSPMRRDGIDRLETIQA